MGFVANDDTKKQLCQLLLYGVVNRPLLGWTEQIWQSSLWRAELIHLLNRWRGKIVLCYLSCYCVVYSLIILFSLFQVFQFTRKHRWRCSTYPLSTTTRNRLTRGWYRTVIMPLPSGIKMLWSEPPDADIFVINSIVPCPFNQVECVPGHMIGEADRLST